MSKSKKDREEIKKLLEQINVNLYTIADDQQLVWLLLRKVTEMIREEKHNP